MSGSTIRRQQPFAASHHRLPAAKPKKPDSAREKSRAPECSFLSSSCCCSWAPSLRKGCLPPVITMYMVTPAAQTSQRLVYPRLYLGNLCISGDMKAGVPHFSAASLPAGRKSASPKSESFSWSPWTIKLSGLMSRWQMPLTCSALMASKICLIQSAASCSSRVAPRSFTLSPKSPPSQYSSAIQMLSESSKCASSLVTFLCSTARITWISFSMSCCRTPRLGMVAFSSCLTATVSLLCRSTARQTVPKEPSPSLTFCRKKWSSTLPDACPMEGSAASSAHAKSPLCRGRG
mmetsp:Transcript_94294/g.249290  ORF Transcript_94294/g.249290 Transcript_94294/m.249290 type:complete len:291 (-) Transcript_94294:105-977(-)